MTALNDHRAVAHAIVAAHGLRFGAITAAAISAGSFSSDDPVYRGAKQACTALGFIEIDSECLAQAWQAQTVRTGAFDADQWPETPTDFGMRAFPPTERGDAFAPSPERLGLYAVLPDARWVGRMARAGVPTVQLRFKSDDAQAVVDQVRRAEAAARGSATRLFINDHWQVAMSVHAQVPGSGIYGIHLGQEDIDDADLVAIRSAGLRLGISTHGFAEMLRVAPLNPSYLALGAVFATPTKTMPTVPQGLGRLFAYAAAMRTRVPAPPLVAIGGIDLAAMPRVLESGVGSVAVVRAITQAADVPAAVDALQATFAAHVRA